MASIENVVVGITIRSNSSEVSLKARGVDLIDVFSGALIHTARIPVAKGYQVPFARRIRDEADIATGAVGLITEAGHANEIIAGGDADLVFLARELLREPYWALKAQQELGEEPTWHPIRLRSEAAVKVSSGRRPSCWTSNKRPCDTPFSRHEITCRETSARARMRVAAHADRR